MIAKTVIVSESVLCNVPNNKMYVKYEITNFETVFSVNNKIKKTIAVQNISHNIPESYFPSVTSTARSRPR